MSKLKALASLVSNPKALTALLSFHSKGYLNTIGWFKSFESKQSVDMNGNPIPWVTYSFIDFIQERIAKTHAIFEYGSGNSTHYYASKAETVVSVEHDEAWFNSVKGSNPKNAEIIFCALHINGDYSRMAAQTGKKYDVIIVDGRDRVNCCKHSVDALADGGVLVLDDSERADYNEGRIFLKNKGYKELKFSGISPGLFYYKSTSVFYKANNCLDI